MLCSDALWNTVPDGRLAGDKTIVGRDLYSLLERLRAVLKICVLKRLRFNDDKIIELVKRNRQMRFVQSLKWS